MTKRTAMLMAAGVVLALLGGSVALSIGLSGNGTAEAGTRTRDPIVRTIHRTVRVERQAKGSDRAVQVVTLQAPSSEQTSSSPDDDAYGDGTYEDHGSDDDAYEHGDDGSYDDHGDDGSYDDRSVEHEDDD